MLLAPDYGRLMTKAYKGWLCPNGECSLIRVRGHPLWRRVERVYREARPRPSAGDLFHIFSLCGARARKRKKEAEKRKKPKKPKPRRAPKGHEYGDRNTDPRYECLLPDTPTAKHGKNFRWKERCWKCPYLQKDL